MSELDKIKQSIREQNHFVDEKQIDWIARKIHREKFIMGNLQAKQIELLKEQLNKKSS